MIGSTLGHYEIVERIGRGGMGEVYRARDTKLDRDVALKILPADKADDAERIQRLEREAKAVAALNHPNIVTIHSVEQVGEHRFLTMELVEGKTISEMIPDGGFSLERFFEIAIPLSDALSAAHTKGVAHRDLKPSNIMVDGAGRLKVLDFGLAKLLDESGVSGDDTVVAAEPVTAEGKIVGTVAYMSPEQAESKALDHRSDIFSLGVVMYEMATGDRPFQGDTPLSTMSAILKDTPTPVTERKAMLPRHLGRVIGRCLEKKPDRRFQTARDVCNELDGLREEIESGDIEQLVSATLSRDDVVAAKARRGRGGTAGWIAAALVLALAAGYYFFLREPSGSASREMVRTPMTSLVGYETVGSWSPDGSFFAYSHSADGPTDIFIVSSAGGNPMRLVSSPYDDGAPRWSPDNRWIAFVSNRGQLGSVYLVPPLGGEPQLLASMNLPAFSQLMFGGLGATPWSADGKKLLFARMDDAGMTRIWEVDMESRQERPLTEPEPGEFDAMASLSHDGSQIVFLRYSPGTGARVMLMPAEGGEPSELYLHADNFVVPVWGPDDMEMLVSPGEGGLLLVDLSSREVEQLTTGTEEHMPAISQDGRILYSTNSHQTDLYLQDVSTGEARRLTRHTQDNFGAAFSPDGRFVAYDSNRTGDDEIWLIELESGVERRLTQRDANDWNPKWSHDGEEIFFQSMSGGSLGLWAVSPSGGAPRSVDGYPKDAGHPRVSPDGEWIGFLKTDGAMQDLHAVARDGGEARLLLAGVSRFEWYLDSRRIIYAPSDPTRSEELRARNLETGEDLLLATTKHTELEVARDGSVLSFVSAMSHYNMNLHILRLNVPSGPNGLPTPAGEVEKITHGDGEWHVHNGSFDSNGSRVVYTRDTDAGDIYLLEGVF